MESHSWNGAGFFRVSRTSIAVVEEPDVRITGSPVRAQGSVAGLPAHHVLLNFEPTLRSERFYSRRNDHEEELIYFKDNIEPAGSLCDGIL